jgi:hypothetical protein
MTTECCATSVSCADATRAVQLWRGGHDEECFCVAADGLATGSGVFRTPAGDLAVQYEAGARVLGTEGAVWRLVNARGFELGLVLGVVAVGLIVVGVRRGNVLGLTAVVLCGAAGAVTGWYIGAVVGLVGAVLFQSLASIDVGAFGGALVGLISATRLASRWWSIPLAPVVLLWALGAVTGASAVFTRDSSRARVFSAVERAPAVMRAE